MKKINFDMKTILASLVIVLFLANFLTFANQLPVANSQLWDGDEPEGSLNLINNSTVDFTSAGSWNENFYLGSKVEIQGNYAYVLAEPNGLLIFDITDPAAVVRKSVLKLGEYVSNLHVSGNYVYIADNSQGLLVVDVTNKEIPILIETFSLGVSETLDVFIDGEIAYVACGSDGVLLVNVTEPTTPVIIDTMAGGKTVQSITISDHIAYLATQGSGFAIFNVTDIGNITLWVENPDTTTVNQIEVVGDTFYVARDSGIEIYNHSTPGIPVAKGTYSNGKAKDIDIECNILVIAAGQNGIDFLNVSNENSPEYLSTIALPFTGWATGVKVDASMNVFFIDAPNGIQVYDASDLYNPYKRYSYGIVGYAYDIAVEGTTAYVANGNITLSTVDVTHTYNLTSLGQWDGFAYSSQVEYYEGYVYFLDLHGILIFNVSDPAKPELMMNLTSSDFTSSFQIYDDYLYILFEQDLQIWDISNPTSCVLVNTYNYYNLFYRDLVVCNNDILYLLCSNGNVNKVNISDKTNLIVLGNYTVSGNAYGIYHYNEFLYHPTYSGTIEVVNASDIYYAEIVLEFTGLEDYHISDVVIKDGLLFATLGYEGLRVLDIRSLEMLDVIGSFNATELEYFYGLEVVDNTVYLAAGYGGVRTATFTTDLDPLPTPPENNTTPIPTPTIYIPGYTFLIFTCSLMFLGTLVILARRRT